MKQGGECAAPAASSVAGIPNLAMDVAAVQRGPAMSRPETQYADHRRQRPWISLRVARAETAVEIGLESVAAAAQWGMARVGAVASQRIHTAQGKDETPPCKVTTLYLVSPHSTPRMPLHEWLLPPHPHPVWLPDTHTGMQRSQRSRQNRQPPSDLCRHRPWCTYRSPAGRQWQWPGHPYWKAAWRKMGELQRRRRIFSVCCARPFLSGPLHIQSSKNG